MSKASIILAAGKGTRMKSEIPKVLNQIAGRPMLNWVMDTLRAAGIERHCLVIGGDLNAFDQLLKQSDDLTICEQIERQGTGDAVASAHAAFRTQTPGAPYNKSRLLAGDKIDADYVIICAGDTPNIKAKVVSEFIQQSLTNGAPLSVLGMHVPNPYGYGRIVRSADGGFVKIIEEKDANDTEKTITLCNSGLAFGKTNAIFQWITRLKNENAQCEYYLTDIFSLARQDGSDVFVYETDAWQSFSGVNTRQQLEELEKIMCGEN